MRNRIRKILLLSIIFGCGLSGCGRAAKDLPVETVTRNDGVTVPLSELEEICKDVVYNKALIIKHSRENDPKKADEARAYYRSFSADLNAFKELDRDRCMKKFDTPANVRKYQ